MDSYLTTSSINQLVEYYQNREVQRQITPLQTRKAKYTNLSSAWGSLNSRLNTLKGTLSTLKESGTSSIFSTSKTASTSNSSFVSVSASSTAAVSAYQIRVDQLAKGDVIVSQSLSGNNASITTPGTYEFRIGSGDYTSKVEVELTEDDFTEGAISNSDLMAKIADAVNSDLAIVESSNKTKSSTVSGTGESTFTIDMNGTEYDITIDDVSGMTYDDLLTAVEDKIQETVSGVTAEKVNVDESTVGLNLTVNDPSKYISITHKSGVNLVSDLSLSVTKEKGGSGLGTASSFDPVTGSTKLTFTSLSSGYENRLILADTSGSLLNSVGLSSDILTNRYKTTDDDSAGFIYGLNTVGDLVESSTNNSLNSMIEFNGVNVQRSSNVISDLATGVSITLNSVMEESDTTVNLTVKKDVTKVKAKIQEFVNNFNNAYTYVKSQSASSTLGRGLFAADPTASALIRNLTTSVSSQVSGLEDEDLYMLSQIGISFDPTTGLKISDTDLTNALTEDMDGVAELFNSDNGVAAALYDVVEPYLGSEGLLSKLQSSYDSSSQYLTDRMTSIQSRIDKSSETLRARYEQLQLQLASLMTQSSAFSASSGSYF